MEGEQRANVLALVQRFEKWSKELKGGDDDKLFNEETDEEDEEYTTALEGVTDPEERRLVKAKIKQKRHSEALRRQQEAAAKATQAVARNTGRPSVDGGAKEPGKLDESLRQKFVKTDWDASAAMTDAVDEAAGDVNMDMHRRETLDADSASAGVTAYWDEETQTYWYTDESTGKNFWWNEETQDYEPEPSEEEVEEEAEAGAAKGKLKVKVEADRGLGAEEEFIPTSPEILQKLAADMKVDVSSLLRLEKGVKAYAFVKANGGMLKPLKLYYRASKGKLYIVRNNRSQYLHVLHFGEINKSASSLDDLTKDEETGEAPLQNLPHIIFFTNEVYHQATKRKKHIRLPTVLKKALKKQVTHRRSLLFVCEDFEERDVLFEVVSKSAKMLNIHLDEVV